MYLTYDVVISYKVENQAKPTIALDSVWYRGSYFIISTHFDTDKAFQFLSILSKSNCSIPFSSKSM